MTCRDRRDPRQGSVHAVRSGPPLQCQAHDAQIPLRATNLLQHQAPPESTIFSGILSPDTSHDSLTFLTLQDGTKEEQEDCGQHQLPPGPGHEVWKGHFGLQVDYRAYALPETLRTGL